MIYDDGLDQVQSSGIASVITTACKRLIQRHDDFWLLAALGDWSFEEGSRNAAYRRYVDTWRGSGLPAPVLQQLDLGINGNLADEIRWQPSVLPSSVHQSPSFGPDIIFRTTDGISAQVEVKMVYDCTLLKYYPDVASDLRKLDERLDKTAAGFLVVCFIQLPNYDYPAGEWYQPAQHWSKRVCVKKGIVHQFDHLVNVMNERPWWPAGGPCLRSIPVPTPIVTEAVLRQHFRKIFRPSAPWEFNANEHLGEAAIGIAIWQR